MNQAAFHVFKVEHYLQGIIDIDQVRRDTGKNSLSMVEVGKRLDDDVQLAARWRVIREEH
jgi:hypothetical protein